MGQPPTISTDSLVQLWVNEKNNYHGGPPVIGWIGPTTTGHYTQMVWNTTKEVGCGTFSTNKVSGALAGAVGKTVYMVCRYSPPGNSNRPPY